MNTEKQFAWWEFTLLPKMSPVGRKTLRSLINDRGKDVRRIISSNKYKTIRAIYNAIKTMREATREDMCNFLGRPGLFDYTSYPLQYLLLRNIVDRKKKGRQHIYYIVNNICDYNPKYRRLIFKRW